MTLANIFLHYIIVRLPRYVVHLSGTTDMSTLVTDAWNEWILEMVDMVLPKRSAKVQPSRVFWKVGSLSEDLIWSTYIKFKNNSASINILKDQYMTMIYEIAGQPNECCAENQICPASRNRRNFISNTDRSAWLVTMHSIATVYELNCDCIIWF